MLLVTNLDNSHTVCTYQAATVWRGTYWTDTIKLSAFKQKWQQMISDRKRTSFWVQWTRMSHKGFVHRHSDNRAPRRREDNHAEATQDQLDPALHQWSVQDSQKGPQATGHQGGSPPTLHSTPPTGWPQGPCTNVPTSRSGVSDPLLRLPQSVHWSVWQEPEAPVVWAPMGPPEWGCGYVCFGWTHGPLATMWTYPRLKLLIPNPLRPHGVS